MGKILVAFIGIVLVCGISVFVYHFDISIFKDDNFVPPPFLEHTLEKCQEHSNTTIGSTSFSDVSGISCEDRDALEAALWWPLPNHTLSEIKQASVADHSSCIIPPTGKGLTVGDILNVTVVVRDATGNPKTYGGDFLQAKLYNTELKASSYGLVLDHDNGSYTVQLRLPWAGPSSVAVRMIHSSEAVQVLARQRQQDPDKVFFIGVFKQGDRKESVVCNSQKTVRLIMDSPCCCEFREPVSGEVWLCRTPPSLPCSAWVSHHFGGYQAQLSNLEKALLNKRSTNVRVPGCGEVVNVGGSSTFPGKRGKCVPGLKNPVPAGFYMNDQWTSLVCKSQHFSTAQQVSACLKDKQLLMMGDSTLRQWFEYLLQKVPSLKQLNLYTSTKSGPFEAVDTDNNIRLVWRAHGPPLRTNETPRADLHYIAHEIEGIAGGEHSVVVFTIWAHFTTHPVATYIQRLANIRQAVVLLLQRSPRSLVVIKSANTGYKDVYGSDWLSWQLDQALRVTFRSLPVVIIDVWQMTSCHYSPDNIHPPPVVISNEVDLFLSFVCP